ncbi:MAG: alanine dehydrogenase [Methylomicrobium sp.]
MQIGVPKEIKDQEGRVALTPGAVARLVACGHEVVVECGAGLDSGFSDERYRNSGARLVGAEEAWEAALVVKVKEPLPSEYHYLKQQTVFTFFHLAGVDSVLTDVLLQNGTTAIAYELVEDAMGRLPILVPMSAIAGNMATLMGAYYLAEFNGGKGVQLGRVGCSRQGRVLVVGDGVVGQHAARTAVAMGADVQVAGIDESHMAMLKRTELTEAEFLLSTRENLRRFVVESDLVVGAVLCRGDKAPKIIDEAMIASMEPGSVVVDVSIDQGGCIETSRPTSHSAPTFSVHNVIHYCVSNMPGAYPRTSTLALNEATIDYVVELANAGPNDVQRLGNGLKKAVVAYRGKLTHYAAAAALGKLDHYQDLASF